MLKADKVSQDINQLLQQGLVLHQQGLFSEAHAIYEKILKIQPQHFDALQLLGTIAIQAKNYEECVNLLTKALEVKTNYAPAHYNLGIALHELKHFEEAIVSFNKAISLKPNYINAYNGLGCALKELNQFEAAVSSFDKAIGLNANSAETYTSRGTDLLDLKQFDAAIVSFDKAISLDPNDTDAYINRGVALHELKRLDEAIWSYDKAISLNPNDADTYTNRGVTLNELKRYEDALSNYDHAIQLNPDHAEAYSNRGSVLQQLKRLDEAFESINYAIRLNPKLDYLLSNFIYIKMHLCNWEEFHNLINQLAEEIIKGEIMTNPFVAIALIDKPALHKQSAKIFSDNKFSINNLLGSVSKFQRHQKIRIGYFSADFREHAVSYLTAELFELHDRNQFEVIAFSFGVDTQDAIRKRLEQGFDQFLDIKDQTDQEIAMLAREMEIDIAVDLGGFTENCRTGIFARRAAPIQLSYIGYLGTMGAEYFDYLIADPVIIPQDYQQYYSEKIVYLPSYQVNDTRREISEKLFTRSELGLPANGFVFCCFNNSYKITPPTFDRWMRILIAAEGSVLFLLDSKETATNNLKKEAMARGVSPDRLVFAKHLPLPEYLARYRIADLFLDTLPYNAGTTASDALRVGLPVLTLTGKSFASRVAASLLNAVGLPELITNSQEEYESLAIKLAKNPEELSKIKKKLINNLPTSALYNTKMFTQHLESAYQTMYQRYHDGLPTEHIVIK